jgi:hypothetical protein
VARDEFEALPGIGPSLAGDLRLLGVKSFPDLARRDPERLYARLCDITKSKQDPCVLYVFRCAVYATRTKLPDPKLLLWWSWMERRFDDRGRIVATEKGVPEKYRRLPADVKRERARLAKEKARLGAAQPKRARSRRKPNARA